ncbi:right-handed parallel beta-helix repeat-containing protein [Agrilutibacter solisilvae]|uniref:Right-handed parallel beta-helix repeat-containing protein n=1 Tax=Agrilutibacter solisilvae TaxID=2763317 RepID=A0A974Y2E4_9GAMM|nr:right-handed parallel beta-helix repeat-containing protein [Lysobacter solisilvae]QSX79170.1 right-handed parallel beta-helix repeat-containing protein [Lysobacter solisilvae]
MVRPVLLIAVLLAAPQLAHAARSYDNCTGFIDALPATISTRGTWCLRADLDTAQSSGGAITVNADNVVVDCNDHRLSGLAGGGNTIASGVVSRQADRHNITVRNCSIQGFRYGVALIGFSHLVEGNTVEASTYVGIATRGQGNVVRDNLVRDTGGQANTPTAYGITVIGGEGVAMDNTVVYVDGGAPGAQGDTYAYGIMLQRGVVQRNRILRMQFIGVGIQGLEAPMILDNVVYGGSAESGVAISGGGGTCRGNQVAQWEADYLSCTF